MKTLEGWLARDNDPVGEMQLLYFSEEPEINDHGRWCKAKGESFFFELPDDVEVDVPAGEKLKVKITIEVDTPKKISGDGAGDVGGDRNDWKRRTRNEPKSTTKKRRQ